MCKLSHLESFFRLENTLNYGLERVWAVGYIKGSRRYISLPFIGVGIYNIVNYRELSEEENVLDLCLFY